MPPRTVTVDGATFRIDKELTAARSGSPKIISKLLRWESVFHVPETPGLVFQSATMNFSAAVTLVSGAEAGVWQAGFVQNVTAIQRAATYKSGATIHYRVEYGPAMRDGEDAELPFSYNGTELAPDVRADLHADDDPKMELPNAVDKSPLVSTGGVDELVTWLSLARAATPRMTVLLGLVTWQVNWAATKPFAFQYVNSAEVPHVVATVHDLHEELTADTALADYRSVPDYRSDASTNEYMVGRLTRPDQSVTQWVFNDDDKAVQVNLHALSSTTWFTAAEQ